MLPISSVGAPVLAGPGPAIGLVGRRLAAAGEDFRAADQDARIDAEGVAEQAEHDDGADAEPAAAHRKAEAAATAHSAAAIVATVLDIVAAAEIIVTHGGFSSSRLMCICGYPTRHRRKISIPLINNPPGKNCLVPLPFRSNRNGALEFFILTRFLDANRVHFAGKRSSCAQTAIPSRQICPSSNTD